MSASAVCALLRRLTNQPPATRGHERTDARDTTQRRTRRSSAGMTARTALFTHSFCMVDASDPLRFILFQWPAETTHSASANTETAALPLLDNGPSDASRPCRACQPAASRRLNRLSVTNRAVYPDAPSPGVELPCKATCPLGTSQHREVQWTSLSASKPPCLNTAPLGHLPALRLELSETWNPPPSHLPRPPTLRRIVPEPSPLAGPPARKEDSDPYNSDFGSGRGRLALCASI